MQWVCPVDDGLLPQLRAACHVDGTTRPQICSAGDNPRYHRLLQAYGEATGVAALLNTSLNERGTPMAASPIEALAMLARTDMDALVLDLALVRKEW